MNTKKILTAVSVIGVIATAGALYQYVRAENYRTSHEHTYQRAFTELADYVGNMDILLNKALVTNDKMQFSAIANRLYTETALAKSAMGQLPLYATELDKTSSFITQVSDFVNSISSTMLKGGTLTDEQYKNLSTLAKYSDTLNKELKEMEDKFEDGSLTIAPNRAKAVMADENIPNISDALTETEKAFEDYPTIIYDGPFSHHVVNKKPEVLNQPGIDREYALSVAEEFSGINLVYSGETDGNIPSYMFTSPEGDIFVEISRNGGKVVMMTDSNPISDPQIEIENAQKIADDFLKQKGYENMLQTGYIIEENTVNFAFAYTQDDYTIYPDLVKIKVSLHDGNICGFEANGYLCNHKWRKPPKPLLSQESVTSKINKHVTISKVSLACIPKDNGTEAWCYEIVVNSNNKTFLVYVNALTGDEEDILLYVEDGNGSLTI